MPKGTVHHQGKAPKSKKAPPVPPSKIVNFQVVWSGVDTSSPSLILHAGTKSYLFNCGEGLQRVMNEKKIKLSNMDSIYLTQHRWSHIGGLFGIGLSLRDISSTQNVGHHPQNVGQVKNVGHVPKNVGHIPVNSPPGMGHILVASKAWLRYDDEGSDRELKVYDRCSSRQDGQLRMESVLIHGKDVSNTPSPSNITESLADTTEPNNWVTLPTGISSFDMRPNYTIPAMCYVCHLNPLLGKFDPVKAKELGIPSGPLRAKLVHGSSVVLPDGRTIQPEDVISATTPGPICVIIDCPSVSHIESLTTNSKLQTYHSGSNSAHIVFHFTPQSVCRDESYVAWMSKFAETTKHVFLDGLQQKTLPFESQNSLQFMLNQVDPKFFPLIDLAAPRMEGDTSVRNFSKFFVRNLMNDPSKVVDEGDSFASIEKDKLIDIVNKAQSVNHQQQQQQQQQEQQQQQQQQQLVDTASNTTAGELVNGKRTSNEEHCNTSSPKRTRIDVDGASSENFPRTVCLGTGSCMPSKYRNVSATLLFLTDDVAVLLDCGEGTYCELTRHYGDSFDSILRKIRFIFISHMHPDHHLGLITLLLRINQVRTDSDDLPLVMFPSPMYGWLKNYAEASQGLKFNFCTCYSAYGGLQFTDTIEVRAVKVNHPACAHGLVISCGDGLKITYSGDTMPCDNLITAGMNSKLLIHEATLEDDMEEDALRKRHSTTSQAVDVARQMKAEWVLLTHISQRYPKIPIVEENELSSRTAYAFDHMEIVLEDIPRFSTLVPTLNVLNELIEDEKPFNKPDGAIRPPKR